MDFEKMELAAALPQTHVSILAASVLIGVHP